MKNYLPIIHQAALSLNVALALTSGVLRGDGVFVPFVKFASLLNRTLGLGAMNATGGYLAFLVYVVVLALLLIFVLLLLKNAAIAGLILIYAAGFLAVGAGPATWFYIVHWHGWYPIEVGAALFCVALYLAGVWRVPSVLTGILLTIHFGFWGLRFWEYTHDPVELLIPAVGYVSVVTWTAYVHSSKWSLVSAPAYAAIEKRAAQDPKR